MLSLSAPAPVRLFFIAVSVLLALALGGCAGMLRIWCDQIDKTRKYKVKGIDSAIQ